MNSGLIFTELSLFDYSLNFYNSIRLHSKLGKLSPNALERKSATQPTY